MDKNQIIGLVLMLLILTIYFQFFTPDIPEPIDESQELTQKQQYDSAIVQSQGQGVQMEINDMVPSNGNDSLFDVMNTQKFGIFADYAIGEEQEILIENDDIAFIFSNKGGFVKQITLKNYLASNLQPLVLLNEQSSNMDILVKSNYQPINISELYFQFYSISPKVTGQDSLILNFSISLDENRKIEQIYIIYGAGYQVGYQLKMTGMDGVVDNEDLQMNWVDRMITLENQVTAEREKATVNYVDVVEGFDNVGFGDNTKMEVLSNPVKWVTFKQQFFLSGIIAQNNFKSATVSSEENPLDSAVVKIGTMNLIIPIGDVKSDAGKFTYYFGPVDYKILKKVGDDFEQNLDLGWILFRVVNQWLVLPIFHFLERFISNYGLLIIILVIIIRIILSPLTYKSHMSMAKMKVVKPELDALKEKVGDNQQKFQQEQMAFFSKAGINPLSGCIPMLLQFPILLALFNFFPNSIELRQKSFLWAPDLSTYDSILDLPFTIPFYGAHVSLFTLLMTVSTILITHSNSQMSTQMQGPMKTMQYMMPIMFLFFLNSYSSGLTFYYFVTNIVSFVQIALFKKIIDEDKVLKIMEENKKKNANKKKSGFQIRLEESMKASQEIQAQKKKKKK